MRLYTQANQSRVAARAVAALLAAFFAAAAAIIVPAALAQAVEPVKKLQGRDLLDHGHVDMFNVDASSDGKLSLLLKEDVTGSHVMREPNTVFLQVKDKTYTDETKKIPHVDTAGYVLPAVQVNNSLWPGWDTQGAGQGGTFKQIDMVMDKIAGPGNILVWENGNFGVGTKAVTKSEKLQLKTADAIVQPYPAHKHVNWLFTKKGVYRMKVHAEGENAAGTLVKTPTKEYTWIVGDDAAKLLEADANNGMLSFDIDAVKKWTSCEDLKKAGVRGFTEKEFPELYKLLAHLDTDKDGSVCPQLKGESSSNATGEDKSEEGGRVSAPASSSSKPESAPTVSSSKTEPCLPVESEGGKGGSGSHTIAPNTHVHPNWVFTKPGSYTVGIRQTATLKSGKKVSADTTLKFNIGGSGNRTRGHFDLGAQIKGTQMVASLKDDSVSPARWVDPASITFGVGNAAKMKAVRGMEFIASPGATVYTIPATQIASIPWLGANTQHPTVVNGTTGGVTWSMTSLKGPGDLAVFEAGNFGKAVGTIWFSSKGGASKVVGRTASGEECNLAATGGGELTMPMAVLAGGALILGAGIVVARASARGRRSAA